MTRHPAGWPWWLQVLAVHAASRLAAAVVFVAVARTQAATGWMDVAPSYLEYTGLQWDASWYRVIAEEGYPAGLPVGADGRVQQNAWAFYPLFPFLVRPMLAAGLAWHVAAPLLALALSGVAMLLVHQVLEHAAARPAAADLPERVRRALPLTTVALLSAAPAAPVLQTAYTEALALLLLAAALWALQRERYALMVLPVLALGLTRAVALPLAAAVAAHGVARWRREGAVGFPASRRLLVAGVAVLTLASGLLWPGIAAVALGRPDAFTATQAAWRGRGEVVPVLPWLDVSRWLLGDLGPPALLALLAALVALLAGRPLRRLGAELWGWTAGYLGFLVVAVEPGTSVIRFSLLAFPVAGVLAQLVLGARRPRTVLVATLALGLACQVAWVALVWRLVPPSGWPP
ncbi:MAG TPA: hypothetical protein VN257_02015 [Actinotalea sp.]|nr:hypothetical protein [Actinotalea sp.]